MRGVAVRSALAVTMCFVVTATTAGCGGGMVWQPLQVPTTATRYETRAEVRVEREGTSTTLRGPMTMQNLGGYVFVDAADGSVTAAPADATRVLQQVAQEGGDDGALIIALVGVMGGAALIGVAVLAATGAL